MTPPVHTAPGCPYSWFVTPHRDVTPEAHHHAHQAVTLARARVDHVRRQYGRRQAGAADVHAAAHQFGRALDHLARLEAGAAS